MLILLADDERLVRMSTQNMIEELYPNEHKFIHAKNGLDAVEILLDPLPPDIAFIDFKMPYKNGIEVIEQIRKSNKHTKCILLSGYDLTEFKSILSNLCVSVVLLKPAALEDINRVLAQQ